MREGGMVEHTRSFSVDGLVCGTCLVEVLERLHDLDGVVEVGIRLEVEDRSPVVVRCQDWVAPELLHAAVLSAGFDMSARTLDGLEGRGTASADRATTWGARP
jgi:copper chaperone CopZ